MSENIEKLLGEILAELKIINDRQAKAQEAAVARSGEAQAMVNSIMSQFAGIGGLKNGQ